MTGLYGMLDAIKLRLFVGNPSVIGSLYALWGIIRAAAYDPTVIPSFAFTDPESGYSDGNDLRIDGDPEERDHGIGCLCLGYSFITEEKNNFTITQEMFMDIILKCDNSQVRKMFGEASWRRVAFYYNHQHTKFTKNNPGFDYMIMTAIWADKTAGISGWDKVKSYWMLLELGLIFIWYLLVLWPLQIMVTEQFLEAMGTENVMTLSSSWQESDLKSDDELMIERIDDMQAGHTSAIARNHYAMELPHFQELKERVFVYTLRVHLFLGLSIPVEMRKEVKS
ncbi:hypothetical protein BU17DRAFT_63534 [Hysterangium stoloniferum]|nr:hypothetical protein BU17DRAFT_63534 [Hysterangium stoloniferum]